MLDATDHAEVRERTPEWYRITTNEGTAGFVPRQAVTPYDPYGRARRLSEAGWHSLARAELKNAILTTAAPVPEPLEYLTPAVPKQLIDRVALEAEGALGFLIVLCLLLVICLVVIWRARRVYLIVEDFHDAFEEGLGRKAAALLRQQLQAISRATSTKLQVVNDTIDAVPVPAELLGAEPTGVLKIGLGLMSRLPLRRVYRIRGELQPEGASGRSLCVWLQTEHRIISSVYLTQREFGPRNAASEWHAYERLASVAAVWARYKLHEQA